MNMYDFLYSLSYVNESTQHTIILELHYIINNNLKGRHWKQRIHKVTKIGASVLLSLIIYSNCVCEAAYAPFPTIPPNPHHRPHPHIPYTSIRFQLMDGWIDGYFVYRRSTLKGHIASNKFYVI